MVFVSHNGYPVYQIFDNKLYFINYNNGIATHCHNDPVLLKTIANKLTNIGFEQVNASSLALEIGPTTH